MIDKELFMTWMNYITLMDYLMVCQIDWCGTSCNNWYSLYVILLFFCLTFNKKRYWNIHNHVSIFHIMLSNSVLTYYFHMWYIYFAHVESQSALFYSTHIVGVIWNSRSSFRSWNVHTSCSLQRNSTCQYTTYFATWLTHCRLVISSPQTSIYRVL